MNGKVCGGRKPSQLISRCDVSANDADDRSSSNEMFDRKSRRPVRDSNVRLRTYEMGFGVTRGKETSRSTTPVNISSQGDQPFHDASQHLLARRPAVPRRQSTSPRNIRRRSRNVRTVRQEQRLPGPHPQHSKSLVLLPLATPCLWRFRRWYLSVRSQTRPCGTFSAKSGAGSPICRCQHQPSDAPQSSFILSPTPYNLTNKQRR
jgi:hypothetical protein